VPITTPTAKTKATNLVNKKRKSDTNGPTQSSEVWLVFNRIPRDDSENKIAACKQWRLRNFRESEQNSLYIAHKQ
jgi:hypothetical protein